MSLAENQLCLYLDCSSLSAQVSNMRFLDYIKPGQKQNGNHFEGRVTIGGPEFVDTTTVDLIC